MPDRSTAGGLIPTLAAVLGVVLTAYLGDWQLDRAAYKRALQERYEQAAHQPAIRVPSQSATVDALAYQPLEAVGAFRPEMTIFLDNRVRQGVVGYEVVTPMQLKDSQRYLLVKRGWVRAAPERTRLPAIDTPSGIVIVQGIGLPPSTQFMELSDQTESGQVWQNLKFDRYEARYHVALQPILLQQNNDLGDRLLRDWPSPATGIDRHRAYALQWFVMSGSIVVIYLVLHVRQKKRAL